MDDPALFGQGRDGLQKGQSHHRPSVTDVVTAHVLDPSASVPVSAPLRWCPSVVVSIPPDIRRI
jgi:hypothetical protein